MNCGGLAHVRTHSISPVKVCPARGGQTARVCWLGTRFEYVGWMRGRSEGMLDGGRGGGKGFSGDVPFPCEGRLVTGPVVGNTALGRISVAGDAACTMAF